MIKFISKSFIWFGILLLLLGGYKYVSMKISQGKTLVKAQQITKNADKTNTNKEKLVSLKTIKNGEVLGILAIPKIDADLPIIEGTGDDDLAKGVGHFKNTGFPLENKQIVLSGHRDTVFRKMGELKIGDFFILKLPYGEFSYKIVNTEIVDAGDLSIIKPELQEEVLTVTTCYPFSYIGNAPERYILTAKPHTNSVSK